MGFLDRLKHAWNAFSGLDNQETAYRYVDIGRSSTYRPDRLSLSKGNERSIITSVYNRIAIDCADVEIKHVRLDDDERYMKTIKSPLNKCLTLEANKDQTARAFIQDVVMSMFDEGCVAVVPIDTDIDPAKSTSFDILTMRVGKIVQWYPDHVELEVFNDKIQQKQNITMAKKDVAIIENPFYAIMNEKNSTLQRLIRKLNILDAIDEQSGSGKLDLIIQLPYIVKTDARREQAEKRRADIENQLAGSKYGIAYTDGTEKITQLNRSVENNILTQIEYLTSMLYSQLGITQSILDGTADEKTMTNYLNRTIKPVMNAITDEFRRKFLTNTARTQGQDIIFFSKPFELIPVTSLAELADKFTRNEIMSSNEFRQIVGLKPIQSEVADELRNKNLNQEENQEFASTRDEIDSEDDNYNIMDAIIPSN